jgi:hypothetical protein
MGPREVAWDVDRYNLPHGEEVAAVLIYGRGEEQPTDAAADLRARGLSLPQIGRRLGVSHQAVLAMLRGTDNLLPPVRCCACAAPVVARSEGGDHARVYCRACLSACPEVPLADRLRSLRLAAGLATRPRRAPRRGGPGRPGCRCRRPQAHGCR